MKVVAYNNKGRGTMSLEKQFNLNYFVPNRPVVQSVVKSNGQWSITIRANSMALNSFLPTVGFRYKYTNQANYSTINSNSMPLVVPNSQNVPIEIVAFNLHGTSSVTLIK